MTARAPGEKHAPPLLSLARPARDAAGLLHKCVDLVWSGAQRGAGSARADSRQRLTLALDATIHTTPTRTAVLHVQVLGRLVSVQAGAVLESSCASANERRRRATPSAAMCSVACPRRSAPLLTRTRRARVREQLSITPTWDASAVDACGGRALARALGVPFC